jgi:hypothetical protein
MWDSVIQFAQESWIELVTTGGVSIAAIKWFVVDKINLAKKELDVINFKAKIQDVGQDVKVVTKVLYDKFEEFQNEFEKQSVKIDSVTKENVMLASLAVQAISVANIPVDAKEKFFNSMVETVKINDEIKKTLEIIIEKQKEVQLKSQETIDNTSEKLSEV